MFLHITNVTKQKMVEMLNERLKEHPDLKDVFVGNKLAADKGYPGKALIITSASANQKRLSNDDFIQDEIGRVALGRVIDKPSVSVEWIKELAGEGVPDLADPGFYFIEILQKPSQEGARGKFSVTSVFKRQEVFDPPVQKAVLDRVPLENKLRVFAEVGVDRRVLFSPSQFVFDTAANAVVLSETLTAEVLIVEYLEAGATSEHEFRANSENSSAISGVELAFGERSSVGDQQVVFIDTKSCRQFQVHGGQWEMSLELTGFAQDPGVQERLVDYATTWIWRDREEFENNHMIIQGVSIGPDAYDDEVEVAGLKYFTAAITVDLITAWEVHSPYLFEWRELLLYQEGHTGDLTDEEAAEIETSLIPVLDINSVEITLDSRPRIILPGLLTL